MGCAVGDFEEWLIGEVDISTDARKQGKGLRAQHSTLSFAATILPITF